MPAMRQEMTRAETGGGPRERRSSTKNPAYQARRLIAETARELLIERPLWLRKESRVVPPS
jgi:hypothetical protein